MSTAERIKEIRKMFHMNQTEFGTSVGITPSLISQMELGKANISWKTSHLIEEKFSISQKWLHFGEGSMFIRDDIEVDTILNRDPEIKSIYERRMNHEMAIIKGNEIHEAQKEWRIRMRKEAADRLKQFRNAYQINQNQLAKRLGYTRAYISAVEKGLEGPSEKMAALIEEQFGVSATWLMYGIAA